MGTRKSTVARIAILGCAGLFCLGANWTWDGGGSDNKWSTCGNWQSSACSQTPGYPSTSNDDVAFSDDDTVELINESIDDLLIEWEITFDGASGATLTVDSLLIKGASDDTSALTVQTGAELLADGSNL